MPSTIWKDIYRARREGIKNAAKQKKPYEHHAQAPAMKLPAASQRRRQCLNRRFQDLRQGDRIANASRWASNG
jgi:hypothetical protein